MEEMKSQSCFKDALNHIKNDVNYPASKQDIMEACSGFSEVSKQERDWFDDTIPDRTFNSANEVVMAIFDKI
jgi:hypothetical protein